jgi:hypothetical protein
MKKLKYILATCSLILTSALVVRAARVVYSQNLVNETALAYNNTYVLDMGSSVLPRSNIDSLSVQAVYSSATIAAVTFIDGTKSTASITVNNFTALHGTKATNTLKIVDNTKMSGVAGTVQVNVASNTFLSSNNVDLIVDGYTLTSNISYVIGASSVTTATNLAAAINLLPGFSATASISTVTISCNAVGVYCNSKLISSSASTRLTASSTKFSGGVDNVYFTLNGIRLTQGIDWTKQDVSSNTSVSIINAINAYGGFSVLTATCEAGANGLISTMTVTLPGTVGNSYTLVSSSQALLQAGGATFSGGINSAILSVNGKILIEGTDFNAVTSTHVTAGNIKNALNSSSATIGVECSTDAVLGVVHATSTAVGANTNYGIFSSLTSSLTVTNSRMFGGTDSDVSNSVFTKSSHGLATGLPVLYTKTAGTDPQNLAANTTYYSILLTANTFKLASSLANAKAGTAITVSTVTGGGTFVLTPLGITGTPSFKWQVSDDNANWSDFTTTIQNVSISSVTMTSLALASTMWDFGMVDHRYLRLNVVAPTAGGIVLTVTGIGKSSN